LSALRDWARLDARWYEDPVLRACAKQAPAAFVMWPVLVGMAKAQSHVDDNPDGLVRVSMDDLANACCVTVRRAIAALEALKDGEFLTVDAHRVGVVCIRLISFSKWQSPRKSKAEQAAKRRTLNSRDFGPLGSHRVAVVSPSSNHDVAIVLPQTETLTETKEITNTSTSAEPKIDHARILFDRWIEKTGRNPNQNRLTKTRRGLVNARLRDGYPLSQLEAAIDGIAASSWHAGSNPSSKRYDTFDFIFRSGENVEKGCEAATGSANVAAAGGDERSAALLAFYAQKKQAAGAA